MSYRIQIELDERAPLKEKVLLHAKFVRHFQRRKMDAGARGRTNWKMQFSSERDRFTIIWERLQNMFVAGCPDGRRIAAYNSEHLMGKVVIKFSKKDIDLGGTFIVTGDWPAIEDHILTQEKVA